MKIIFLTQFFYPDIQATSKIFTELCEDLAQQFELKVICGYPLVETKNTAKHSQLQCNEVYKGIHISRIFSIRRAKKTLFDRAINHISFAISSFFKLLFNNKADLFVFTSDNPLSFIKTILFWKKPKIYICQDLYLEQGLSVGFFKKGVFSWLLWLCQKISFCAADKIVVIGDKMSRYVQNKFGVLPEKIELIPNWADTDKIAPFSKDNIFSREYDLVDKFVIMHSGRLGLTQDLGLLIECAEAMSGIESIRFIIIGEGVSKNELMELAEQKRLKNVIFLTYQSEEALKYSLATADVEVILYKTALSGYLVPSRLYSIMASGRPVIASVEENSEVYDIINRSSCGIIIKPGDLEGLKKAVRLLYGTPNQIGVMGNKGREHVMRYFSRSLMTKRYKDTIEKLAASKKR